MILQMPTIHLCPCLYNYKNIANIPGLNDAPPVSNKVAISVTTKTWKPSAFKRSVNTVMADLYFCDKNENKRFTTTRTTGTTKFGQMVQYLYTYSTTLYTGATPSNVRITGFFFSSASATDNKYSCFSCCCFLSYHCLGQNLKFIYYLPCNGCSTSEQCCSGKQAHLLGLLLLLRK